MASRASPSYSPSAVTMGPFGSSKTTVPWQPMAYWCHCEKRWFDGLQSAFGWLNFHTAGLDDRRRAELRANGWPEIIPCSRPWKTFIKKALHHAIATNKADIYVKQWHTNFVSKAIYLGLDLPVNSLVLKALEDDEEPLQTHGCVQCGLTFKTRAAWAVHAYKIHNRVAPERFLLQSSACQICQREYHTTARLQRHLLYSQRCASILRARGTVGALRPGIGNTRRDRDQPLPLPVSDCIDQMESPEHTQIPAVNHEPLRTDYCPELRAHFLQILDKHTHLQNDEAALEEIQQVVLQSYSDYPDIRSTMQKMQKLCMHDEAQLLHRLHADDFGQRLFARALQQITFEKLFPQQTLRPSPKRVRGAIMEGLHAVRHESFRWKSFEEVPRPCTTHMIILHLFSGHRRDYDIPYFLADMQSPDRIHLTLVPVDIILDPVRGDLSRQEVRERWLFYASTGCIMGIVAGPPCETFSRVDVWEALLEKLMVMGGQECFEVAIILSVYLVCELMKGTMFTCNVLLLFVHELALELLAWEQRFVLKEHPAIPDDAESDNLPSSWDVGSLLKAHPEMRVHTFAQGPFGACSPKPTSFLLRGLLS